MLSIRKRLFTLNRIILGINLILYFNIQNVNLFYIEKNCKFRDSLLTNDNQLLVAYENAFPKRCNNKHLKQIIVDQNRNHAL